MNPILGLWLNKHTLDFRGPLREYEKRQLLESYKRLLWIIQRGIRWAHDTVG
jgi:hypothetical protein